MAADPFDFDDLRYFLAVARTGQLTLAARRLRQNHATVSRRLAALETRLGVRLFMRSPQGYQLTTEGRRLLPDAERIEAIALEVRRKAAATTGSETGTVRIGAPDGIGAFFLAPRLARLNESHPGLQIELIAMPRVFSLSKREADLAIALSRPARGRLYARKLTDYRLQVYASRDYLRLHGMPKKPGDLPAHRLIGYADEFIFAPELDYLPLIAPGLRASFRSSNLVAQFNAARAGEGVCVLPHFMAAQAPELVPLLAGQVQLTRSFWLLVHAELRDLAPVDLVARFLSEEMARERALFMPE